MAKTHTVVKAHKRKLPGPGPGKRVEEIEAKATGAKQPAVDASVAGRVPQHSATGRHLAPTLQQVQARRASK